MPWATMLMPTVQTTTVAMVRPPGSALSKREFLAATILGVLFLFGTNIGLRAQEKTGEEELYQNTIPNQGAWKFLREQVPLFECPDKEYPGQVMLPELRNKLLGRGALGDAEEAGAA